MRLLQSMTLLTLLSTLLVGLPSPRFTNTNPQSIACDATALSDAVNSAPDEAVLMLPAGCTIHVDGIVWTIWVSKPLRIVGDGEGATIESIRTAARRSLVTIAEGGSLNLENITIRNNAMATSGTYTDGTGGGIFIKSGGRATLTNCRIVGNSAGPGAYGLRLLPDGSAGGGIYVDQGATLIVRNSEIRDNHAGNGASGPLMGSSYPVQGGSGGAGGGLINKGGEVTIIQSMISGNSAGNGGDGGYPGGAGGIGGSGGGIVNTGQLLLMNSTVRNNAPGSGGRRAPYQLGEPYGPNSANGGGGGIINSGTMTITGSTIESNLAVGVHVVSGTVAMINSTISQNIAAGILVAENSQFHMSNATLSGNTESGVHLSGGSVTIRNSILLGNRSLSDGTLKDCMIAAGDFVSDGYNLFGASTGCLVAADDKVVSADAIDTVIAPLGNYGGPTATYALPAASLAIDAGNPAGCFADGGAGAPRLLHTDQRGAYRPSGLACDSGAYEVGPVGSIYLPVAISP